MEKSQISRDAEFVVRHYRKGVFDRREAWRSLHLTGHTWWSRHIAAAAAGAAVVVAAVAATVYYTSYDNRQEAVIATESVETGAAENAVRTARFEFQYTQLSVAAKQIEETYGITLTGLPDDDPSVTITFEGTADDLINLINESLDSEISISR